MQPIEIFRTGRHRPMKGEPLDFAEADLDATVAAYDPAVHHAPIVVGHPTRTDAPAYGWISGITRKGDRLVATPQDVDPAFADLVAQRRYAKVSASFWLPDSPSNPTPGVYALRHVGFLGAVAPAVKGLRPVAFGADDEMVIEFSGFDLVESASGVSRLMRRLRDWLIGDKGLDVADQVMPSWEIDALARIGGAGPRGRHVVRLPHPGRAVLCRAGRDGRGDTRHARRRRSRPPRGGNRPPRGGLAEREALARAAEDAAFVAGVVKEGRLPASLTATAVALFGALGDEAVEFAEGDEAKRSPRQGLKDLLAALPRPVATGEIAAGDGPVDFADPIATARSHRHRNRPRRPSAARRSLAGGRARPSPDRLREPPMQQGLIKCYRAEAAVAHARFVKFGAADEGVVQASASTDLIVGISDAPGGGIASGKLVDTVMGGITDLELGGTVTRGALLTSDASGKGVAAAPGAGVNAFVAAQALVSGVSGDIIPVRLAIGRIQG